MRILAISRGENFSPNLVDNDAKILAAVVERLRLKGHEVLTFSENDLIAGAADGERPDAVVNMCRDSRSLEKLSLMERAGARIINSPQGIGNCNRERLTRMLLDAGVSHPDSLIVNTGEPVREALSAGKYADCWVKRADSQTMEKADVHFCRSVAEVESALADFQARGINRAVINKHLPGDLIKFYGVEGTDFFNWFYPLERGHSKFGYEEVNGKSAGLAFSEQELRRICADAAGVLKVAVYGGDAIIGADGSIRIIDFNDWPSFSPCRDEAARAISELL